MKRVLYTWFSFYLINIFIQWKCMLTWTMFYTKKSNININNSTCLLKVIISASVGLTELPLHCANKVHKLKQWMNKKIGKWRTKRKTWCAVWKMTSQKRWFKKSVLFSMCFTNTQYKECYTDIGKKWRHLFIYLLKMHKEKVIFHDFFQTQV